jgi:hypothetical protein
MSAAENPETDADAFEAQPFCRPALELAADAQPAFVTSPHRRRGRARRLATFVRSLWIIIGERPRG